jgi:hypothetical protein
MLLLLSLLIKIKEILTKLHVCCKNTNHSGNYIAGALALGLEDVEAKGISLSC